MSETREKRNIRQASYQEMEDEIVMISGPGLHEQIGTLPNLIGSVVPRESIFLYSREDILGADGLSGNACSQKLLQQFNIDFDRQTLTIQNKRCKTRCTFFRKVTEIVRKQTDMDLLLLLCQQTILGSVLQSVHQTLQAYGVPYLLRDSNIATHINLEPLKKSESSNIPQDLEVKLKKQMYLVDHHDPELVVNVFDIRVHLDSLKSSKEVQVNVKFHWSL